MALDFSKYKCEFCGKPCTNVLFASFVCDNPECIDKARDARGGPGGHMKRKAEGKSIIPEDIIREEQITCSDPRSDPKND